MLAIVFLESQALSKKLNIREIKKEMYYIKLISF